MKDEYVVFGFNRWKVYSYAILAFWFCC